VNEITGISRAEFEDRFCRERLNGDKEYVIGGGGGKAGISGEVMVLRATQASIDRWKANGYKTVSYDELKRRVDICKGCEYNKQLICTSCLGYDTWVYGYIQHISKEMMALLRELQICVIDKAMIIIDVLNDGTNKDGGYKDGCWKTNK